ncbi:signal recognition particle-docking protein FtsY [Lacrimispora saccharolytica]|uniref:signal recognition particle-docking protein FtsY n=1 Tax=Lacrimispora saccharolytica TaxID=84030 RepID=UPI00265C92AD|nr:signal recognition particle-docking protein FtsY [Lacrimispora saccharolytica]MCF2656107.1 signal recognition particle-docking protein FtsY [Lacrimispora saccharolytica]
MANFFAKLKQGLSKTRSNIVDSIESVFTSHDKIDDDFYEELEEILVMGDVGIHATEEILDELKLAVKKRECRRPDECREYLIDVIKEKMRVTESDYEFLDKPSVVMVIGVNGVGKTTTIGKLAHIYRNKGKSVLIAAADTFRAAASEQLEIWAERAGVDMIGANDGADPSSVIYDAVNAARSRHVDVLLCDTAGRLHNKKNLMNELEKMNRIIDKNYPGVKRENLIVLDATTGQNALNQAREFGEVAPLSGIVLTKMDGTAKGGIAIAIQSELGIPVKFIGVGEGIDDLQEFDSDTFVNALFDVKMEEEDAFA